MKTLIIYYQLVNEPDDICHKIYYGFTTLVNIDNINDAIVRHANGKEVRRAWW